MVHRDPDTGKFVAGNSDQFADVEVVSFTASFGQTASNLGGATGFGGESDNTDGLLLIDYDEVVDRNEELHLLTAQHRLSVFGNSTSTEDGTIRVVAEVSASPTVSVSQTIGSAAADDNNAIAVGNDSDDTIDLIGRPMIATGFSPFSDTATGIGGAGGQGEDEVNIDGPPGEMARFHPRDELFANARLTTWNVDDAGIHADLVGQHVYGVVHDS